ncbi:substrate-binding domain-containing protein [Amycolatopsis anabasis]|uniref:substrate-binding domain-containing protein n=1 Tax=Amycolatopsis anabasis TaxID=1840409 RepID=UPI00131C1ACD|nr:substrate-binding domain-containing protein [Amycolatopsis anabasis]
MSNFPWELFLAVFAVVVPIFAFLWEFVFVGRKRLGYRVQMDTTARQEATSENAGAWRRLERESGAPLVDPSFVLLRIENTGTTNIDTNDYAVLDDIKVGVKINFPGRRVAGMVVTELSDEFLRDNFGPKSGLGVRNVENSGRTVGVIELPRTPLNRGQHYKVLTVLERAGDGQKKFDEPEVVAGIKGGVRTGRIRETKSRTGVPRWLIVLVYLLVSVGLAEPFVIDLATGPPAPLDCATGKLTVTGSTAFEPVLREATALYAKTCPDSGFTVDTHGSAQGLEAVNQQRSPEVLAFSDGMKGNRLPQLLPRPIAFLLFTLVINKDAGVQDLTLAQVRDVFAGRVGNWKELGGNDRPVRLVDRESDSGTRTTLERRVLGAVEPGENSNDCVEPKAENQPAGVIRCRKGDTGSLLNAVAGTTGAIGYSELGAAAGREDVLTVRIDGQPATLEGADHGAYPFWQTEYAYSYGELKADSLAASFLRYLTNQVGADIIRSHGDRPCAELANPVLCHPS